MPTTDITNVDLKVNALIIDDSKAMRRILRGIVTGLGFEVVEAGDGKEGFEKLKEHKGEFEFVLVDWNMPVMNGLEFIKTVRADSDYGEMTLLMVTTETEPTRMVQALMAGVDEFVMKPFTPDVLVDKLRLVGVSLEEACG